MSQRGGFVIVSGLPRSGTSMLMQVLEAGGVAAWTDTRRPADASNPRGYFELEAVKRLREEPALLDAAQGRAVKVVAPLLPHVPAGRAVRVLFLHRDMREVIASQRRMLEQLGKPAGPLTDEQLAAAMTKQVARALAWCRTATGVGLLELEHRTLLREPMEAASRIDAFLGGGLDVAAMAAVPDTNLYRQRS